MDHKVREEKERLNQLLPPTLSCMFGGRMVHVYGARAFRASIRKLLTKCVYTVPTDIPTRKPVSLINIMVRGSK